MITKPLEKRAAELLEEDVIDGVPVMVLRGPMSECGYIGIEKGHELYGTEYDDDDYNAVPRSIHSAVNGGLTFSGVIDDKNLRPGPKKFKAANYWWFGWDYSHYENRGTPMGDAKKAIKALEKLKLGEVKEKS